MADVPRKNYDLAKRFLDLILSAALMLFFGPVLLSTALYVRVSLGAPIFFTQERLGLKGKPFTIIKFRTMQQFPTTAESRDETSRFHPAGLLLRRSSLDELPQLWNVFRGDMSLVGPRPLLPEYLSLYSPEQAQRMEVKPGMTGLAQIEGRNCLSWEEKFRLDVRYVEHVSLCLDIRILVRSLGAVVSGKGVDPPGRGAVAPFSQPESES